MTAPTKSAEELVRLAHEAIDTLAKEEATLSPRSFMHSLVRTHAALDATVEAARREPCDCRSPDGQSGGHSCGRGCHIREHTGLERLIRGARLPDAAFGQDIAFLARLIEASEQAAFRRGAREALELLDEEVAAESDSGTWRSTLRHMKQKYADPQPDEKCLLARLTRCAPQESEKP